MNNETKKNYEELFYNLKRFTYPQISFIPEEIKKQNQLFQFLDRLDKEALGIESYKINFKSKNDFIKANDREF